VGLPITISIFFLFEALRRPEHPLHQGRVMLHVHTVVTGDETSARWRQHPRCTPRHAAPADALDQADGCRAPPQDTDHTPRCPSVESSSTKMASQRCPPGARRSRAPGATLSRSLMTVGITTDSSTTVSDPACFARTLNACTRPVLSFFPGSFLRFVPRPGLYRVAARRQKPAGL